MAAQLTDEQLRNRMIVSAVKDAHQFGYPHCTAENIVTDYVYGVFFESIISDVLSEPKFKGKIHEVAERLVAEIKSHRPKEDEDGKGKKR